MIVTIVSLMTMVAVPGWNNVSELHLCTTSSGTSEDYQNSIKMISSFFMTFFSKDDYELKLITLNFKINFCFTVLHSMNISYVIILFCDCSVCAETTPVQAIGFAEIEKTFGSRVRCLCAVEIIITF